MNMIKKNTPIEISPTNKVIGAIMTFIGRVGVVLFMFITLLFIGTELSFEASALLGISILIANSID